MVPRWTGPVLALSQNDPAGTAPPSRAAITHLYEPPPGTSIAPRSWSKSNPDLQVREVCAGCNAGWMNDLETTARPVLNDLIQGRRLNLGQGDQSMLAAWTFKTELMFQLARPADVRCIDASRFAEFYVDRVPPSDFSVWIGATSGGPAVFELATEATFGLGGGKAILGCIAVLAFGNLLLVMAGPKVLTTEFTPVATQTEPSVLQRIWPSQPGPVLWGVSVVIDGSDLSNAPRLIVP